MLDTEKPVLAQCAELIADADRVLISAGAGMSVPAGINYHDQRKFAQLFPGLVKKGYRMQYELITRHAVDNRRGWTAAVKWDYLATHVNYVYYQIQNDETYRKLYSLVQDKNYFVMTTNVDGLFVQNGFDKDKVYTPQGSFSRIQCLQRCTEQTWDAKPIIDRILSHIDPQTQEVNNPACLPVCRNCGGDVFMNVRGGSWFIDQPYQAQLAALNRWIETIGGAKITVLDIGTGFNTPGVVRRPAENIVEQNPGGSLIRINLNHYDIPKEIQSKSISIKGDVSEFINGVLMNRHNLRGEQHEDRATRTTPFD